MSGVDGRLHVVRASPGPHDPGSSAHEDVGLAVMIFVVAAVPLVSLIAGIGRWDDASLGLGTVGVLFAGHQLCAWLVARCRGRRRP